MNKISYRLVMNCITVCLLIYGIFEMKNFLSDNFIDNDTELKRRVDRAFKGQKLQNGKDQIQQSNSPTADNRDRKVIIDIESTK